MIFKIAGLIIFFLGLVYILAPGPQSINNIPPLPDSLKSDEPGDTYQNPNIAAYYANWRRDYVTNFYQKNFEQLNFWGIKIPSIRLNHPPEEAYGLIKDQVRTKYLEQYFYPLRDALYVNGYEPFEISGKPMDGIAKPIYINGYYFDSKTTLRYYHSPVFYRLFIYLSSWTLFLLMIQLTKIAVKEK